MKTLICIMTSNKEPFLSLSKMAVACYNKTIADNNLDMQVIEYMGGSTEFKVEDGILKFPVDDNSTHMKHVALSNYLVQNNIDFDIIIWQTPSSVCNLKMLDILANKGAFNDSGIYGGVMTIQNRGINIQNPENNKLQMMKWSGQILIGNIHIMTRKMTYDIHNHLDINKWPEDIKQKYSILINPYWYKCFTVMYTDVMKSHLPSINMVDDDMVVNMIVVDILHKKLIRVNSLFLQDAINASDDDFTSLLTIRAKMETLTDFSSQWYWDVRATYEPMMLKLLHDKFNLMEIKQDHVSKCMDNFKEYPVPIEEVTPENFDIYSQPYVDTFDFTIVDITQE